MFSLISLSESARFPISFLDEANELKKLVGAFNITDQVAIFFDEKNYF